MRPVHIGIGHNDNPSVAQPLQIKVIPDAGSQSGNEGFDLVVAQDFIQPGPLSVEDFPP
jgi:hypothetical protein